MTDAPLSRSDLLMPVPDEKAIQLMQVEALRGITANLARLNERAERQTEILHTVDKRLDRIESNKLPAEVEDLKRRCLLLEGDKIRRDVAVGAVGWLIKNWPALAMFVTTLFVVLSANGRI